MGSDNPYAVWHACGFIKMIFNHDLKEIQIVARPEKDNSWLFTDFITQAKFRHNRFHSVKNG